MTDHNTDPSKDHWRTASFTELTPHELYGLLRLRQQVFAVEQDCVYLDLDDLDQQAHHMLHWHETQLAAYQRCLPPGIAYPESSIGRIVVDPIARGQQLGRDLVQRGIDFNLSRWPQHDILINAQTHLQAFYGSMGFTGEGKEHIEDGILHRYMRYASAGAGD